MINCETFGADLGNSDFILSNNFANIKTIRFRSQVSFGGVTNHLLPNKRCYKISLLKNNNNGKDDIKAKCKGDSNVTGLDVSIRDSYRNNEVKTITSALLTKHSFEPSVKQIFNTFINHSKFHNVYSLHCSIENTKIEDIPNLNNLSELCCDFTTYNIQFLNTFVNNKCSKNNRLKRLCLSICSDSFQINTHEKYLQLLNIINNVPFVTMQFFVYIISTLQHNKAEHSALYSTALFKSFRKFDRAKQSSKARSTNNTDGIHHMRDITGIKNLRVAVIWLQKREPDELIAIRRHIDRMRPRYGNSEVNESFKDFTEYLESQLAMNIHKKTTSEFECSIYDRASMLGCIENKWCDVCWRCQTQNRKS